jgi:sporulenol synthase
VLDALISASEKPTEEIRKGITYLVNSLEKEDWTTSYPKGQGMAGSFYIHYHSYRYIFPLLALSNYHKKFGS